MALWNGYRGWAFRSKGETSMVMVGKSDLKFPRGVCDITKESMWTVDVNFVTRNLCNSASYI